MEENNYQLKEAIRERLGGFKDQPVTSAAKAFDGEVNEDLVDAIYDMINQTFTYRVRHSKYTQRLLEEWRQYGKIIINVGFDDTISPWKINNMEYCKRVIKILAHAREVGAHIVIHTTSPSDRYEHIKLYCETQGVGIPDAINSNPIELPYGNEHKPFGNVIVEDRAGLEEVLEMLEYCSYVIFSERNQRINFDT